MSIPSRSKKLIVLCDGTWCGRETGTVTNISLLATAIGLPDSTAPTDTNARTYVDPARKLKACYFPGQGLGGTFLDYLFNGETGSDIGAECMRVYQYIVENFDTETEIWMFGLSRGCYTLRCVGGMINNCGIVKPRQSEEETSDLVGEVYAIYRSPYPEDKPTSKKSIRFRSTASYDAVSPIKFMGIIDTVGSLGIPKLDAGVGFDWPGFYDQSISSEVQKVFHARSIHDRLWMFESCRARRDEKHSDNPDLELHERWFPGCHYDLGRQKFKFFRDGVNVVERVFFALPNHLTQPVVPNAVCSDLVLLWLLEAVEANDPHDQVFRTPCATQIDGVKRTLAAPPSAGDLGSGDVYSHMGDFAPAGVLGSALAHVYSTGVSIVDKLLPAAQLGSAIQSFLGVKTILNVLLATRDRRVEDEGADVTPLDEPMAVLGGASVAERAGLERYASLTVRKWRLMRNVVGMRG
jgi:hypothetical protein